MNKTVLEYNLLMKDFAVTPILKIYFGNGANLDDMISTVHSTTSTIEQFTKMILFC